MQELEKILEEIEAEFERRIGTQSKIMAGLSDDVYRYGYGKSLEAYQQGKLFVEDIIRKHMNDGWIPVGKRLPTKEECEKDNNEFLVQTDTGKRFSCEYDPLANGYDNPLWCCNVPVVAWQPLPEPYRPERSDNHDGE